MFGVLRAAGDEAATKAAQAEMMDYQLLQGDCLTVLKTLPAGSAHCCVTSPPYFGLRDYGHEGQIGLERTVSEYVAKLVEVFAEVRRVLRNDGTLWLNLGDSYANDAKWGGTTGGKHAAGLHGSPVGRTKRDTGLKPKDLIGVPWRVAFALQDDGWWLRSDIVWSKLNPMPEPVRDRPTRSHEFIFLLTKSHRYFYDADAVSEPATAQSKVFKGTTTVRPGVDVKGGNQGNGWGNYTVAESRNRRDVWPIASEGYTGAHFAVMPTALVQPCILAGCPAGGMVLDPFNGSGTTGSVAVSLGRQYIGIEINPDYIALAHQRIGQTQPALLSDL